MRTITICALTAIFFSCSMATPALRLIDVELGMTQEQVMEILGEPNALLEEHSQSESLHNEPQEIGEASASAHSHAAVAESATPDDAQYAVWQYKLKPDARNPTALTIPFDLYFEDGILIRLERGAWSPPSSSPTPTHAH